MGDGILKLAVIGHPVGHSLSPAMHMANFAACGLRGTYGAEDVSPERLAEAVARFVAEDYRGFNVTVPHKLAIVPHLTRLDPSAGAHGAVNTVRVEADGSTTGFNTDSEGFSMALRRENFSPSGVRAVVFGAGGAGRTVADTLRAAGASVTLANRTNRPGTVSVAEGVAAAREAELVVNATVLGLGLDDPSPIPAHAFRGRPFAFDLAPVRHETQFLRDARAAGCRACGGLPMLVAQGAAAFRLWTGLEADELAMMRAIRA